MTKLPDLPSDLIKLALKDLEAVENKPDMYEVDMEYFHTPTDCFDRPDPRGVCLVCFAGSVMAETLKSSPRVFLIADTFDADTARKLKALDYFREGWISAGLEEMELIRGEESLFIDSYRVTPYTDDPDEFKEGLQMIADILRKEGL